MVFFDAPAHRKSLTVAGILGLDRSASQDQIKKAYRKVGRPPIS